MKGVKELKFYKVSEFAEVLRLHVNTVYQMIRCGRLQAFRAGRGKRASFRISETEALRMMEFDAKELLDKLIEEKFKSKKPLR